MSNINLSVNGKDYSLESIPGETLSSLLRQRLRLTGTKIGCEEAECGACTVLVDGEPVVSCIYPAERANGQTVLTIEGLSALSGGAELGAADEVEAQQVASRPSTTLRSAQDGRLHPMQELRDAGEILLDGATTDASTPLAAHRLGIRAVYQEFSLVPHLTVAENILLGQMPASRVPGCVDWGEAYRRADEILASIGFVGIDVHKVVRQLSVSHQQMVEIAKAVAVRPRILILDEPSAILSQEELDRLFSLVRPLKHEGTLILYISHRLDEVFEIADRITVLKYGQLVGTVLPREADQNQLIRMMVGRSLGDIFPARQPPREA